MNDLIRRRDALDAIDSWRRDYPLDLQEPIDDCWNSVRELPAVQSDHVADVSKKVEGDCISRQAATSIPILPKEHRKIFKSIDDAFETGWNEALSCVNMLPSVQPERKKGNWVTVDRRYVRCSECGLETTKNELRGIALFGENEPYFCPNCGADMRGGDSE